MIQKIKILHLEDLPEDAELVEYELHKANIKFEKQVVDNKEDYDSPTRLMIGKDDHTGQGAIASDLRKRLDELERRVDLRRVEANPLATEAH